MPFALPIGLFATQVSLIFQTYSNTISLGAVLISICVGIATLIAVVYGVRYKVTAEAAAKTNEQLKEQLDLWKIRGDDLSVELRAAVATIGKQKEVITRLEQLPNLEKVLKLMADSTQVAEAGARTRADRAISRITEQLQKQSDEHEEKAEHRMERLLDAIRKER